MKLRARYTLQILGLVLVSLVTLAAAMAILFRAAYADLSLLHERIVTEEFSERLETDSVFLAKQIADSLAPPLYNYDKGMIQQIVRVARAGNYVSNVKVFDLYHELLSDERIYTTPKALSPAEYKNLMGLIPTQTQRNNIIRVVQPLIHKDQVIGGMIMELSSVEMSADIEKMRELSSRQEEAALVQIIKVGLIITVAITILSILMSQMVIKGLIQPLFQLVGFANKVGQGNYLQRLNFSRDDELGQLGHAMNHMATNLHERTEKINQLAYFDHLTELPNRISFIESLIQWISNADKHHSKFAIFYLDLDGFKKINDTFGHEVGDEFLCLVAARLSHLTENEANMNHPDFKPVLSRVGGDEFMLLMEIESEVDAAAFANSLIETTTRVFRIAPYDLFTSPSIGIARYPKDGNDYNTLMKRADIAMYSAKSAGKKDFRFFDTKMDDINNKRVHLEGELRAAINNSEFELWYQPLVEINNFKIIGAEALIRWNNPKRGYVSPVEFIPIAEETGLINTIGQWVIEEACSQVSIWEQKTEHKLKVSINISAVQIKQLTLVNFLRQAIEQSNITTDHLHLEITETALVNDEEAALQTLNELSKIGYSIWLDDFGTGFSSLSHLKKYPVSGVKIDRSFISDIDSDTDDRELASAVVAMADALKLDVVAEGIETESQLELLMKMNCKIGQGYYFSKPLPAEAFLKKLKEGF